MSGARETERLRRCREVFSLALAGQMTMDAARRELARQRWAAIDARLAASRAAAEASRTAPTIPADAPWMMRD